ncbi:hypothetical protein EVA_12672 [gut metagenome]|uniref:Uncharacterized protein n=1 Tax=gut metagenome TaxID=749906 RepID=J9FW46_9ZZZZ
MATGKMGNHVIRIDNRNVMGKFKVGSGNNTVTILVKHNRDFVTTFKLENNALQVQKNIHNVFEDAVNLRIFMNNTGNLSFRRSKTDHGTQQNTAKSITKSMTIPTFKRFERNNGTVRIVFSNLNFNRSRLEKSNIGHSGSLCIPVTALMWRRNKG